MQQVLGPCCTSLTDCGSTASPPNKRYLSEANAIGMRCAIWLKSAVVRNSTVRPWFSISNPNSSGVMVTSRMMTSRAPFSRLAPNFKRGRIERRVCSLPDTIGACQFHIVHYRGPGG